MSFVRTFALDLEIIDPGLCNQARVFDCQLLFHVTVYTAMYLHSSEGTYDDRHGKALNGLKEVIATLDSREDLLEVEEQKKLRILENIRQQVDKPRPERNTKNNKDGL